MREAPNAAEARGYSKGYRAGRSRKAREISDDARRRREDALWHRYMAHLMPVCVMTEQLWTRNDKAVNTLTERTELAADFADAAIAAAKRRGRMAP